MTIVCNNMYKISIKTTQLACDILSATESFLPIIESHTINLQYIAFCEIFLSLFRKLQEAFLSKQCTCQYDTRSAVFQYIRGILKRYQIRS